MTLLRDDFTIDGSVAHPNVTERISSARLVGRRKGAASIELEVWDGDGELMRNGMLANSRRPRKTPFPGASWARFGGAELKLDKTRFRLAAIDKVEQTVRLTFDDAVAAQLRPHTREIVISRGSATRAEAIGLAVAVPANPRIGYRCPEEGIRENIEELDLEDEKKGLTGSVTIKGVKATREQRKNAETVLAVADRLKAGERATLALLVACITESAMQNVTYGDRDSLGILQVRQSTAVGITPRTYVPVLGDAVGGTTTSIVPGIGDATDVTGPIAPGSLDSRDVKECARMFLLRGFYRPPDSTMMGAIERAAKEPTLPIEQLAQATQGSGTVDGSNYAPWVNEAKAILDAWGGAGQVQVLRESFEYQIGGKLDPDDDTEKPENYWAGVNRLGSELDGWNLFAWRNRVSFVSDEWLYTRSAALTIGPENVYAKERPADPAELIPWAEYNYRADVGSALQEVTVRGLSRRWVAGPGRAVLLYDLGPASGLWIVDQHDFDLQSDRVTLTLQRPVEKQAEPAPSTRTRTLTETERQEAGSPRDRILQAAERAYKQRQRYVYEQYRPMPTSLFIGEVAGNTAGPVQPMRIDCSAFTTLVYRAAGVPDPNGRNYKEVLGGQFGHGLAGYTGDQAANGKKTTDPQPGDLVFYGSAPPYHHVNLYLGDGQCMNMGPSAGLSRGKIETFGYSSDKRTFYTFDLGGE